MWSRGCGWGSAAVKTRRGKSGERPGRRLRAAWPHINPRSAVSPAEHEVRMEAPPLARPAPGSAEGCVEHGVQVDACPAPGSVLGLGHIGHALEGMDPNSTYMLEIKLLGNKKKVRKDMPCFTSFNNAPLDMCVDMYYSIDKFRAAYGQLIPTIVDKRQWPKSDHGFFMHPPLLKATADYGHHWHNYKRGNPDDIAAMMVVRGPSKKNAKKTKTDESSIVPWEDEAPATYVFSTRLLFYYSQNIEATSKKKGKYGNSSSGASKRSRTDSNQPYPLSIVLDVPTEQTIKKNTKIKRKQPTKKKNATIPMLPLDSPVMCTSSKKMDPFSPAMSTRSKRRLSL
ncbi:uncharacterized protein C2845_PM17G10070 [Panicum miliaceum]|uniref:Uncharacterized protein n=1 Tax=Panicum miliaceum TaxID=4540 RepID=A0A3L6PYR9_PANMI|nr:uncharacterized protein C2845_PM17G10070 [Panicum miliaceum]